MKLMEAAGITIVQNDTQRSRVGVTDLDVPSEHNLLIFTLRGSLFLRQEETSQSYIVPPGTVLYCQGPMLSPLYYGRGHHSAVQIGWQDASLNSLKEWTLSRMSGLSRDERLKARAVPLRYAQITHAIDVIEQVKEKGESVLPKVISLVSEFVQTSLSEPTGLSLSTTSEDIPQTIASLIQEVRKDPTQPWSLKEGAKFAGYSPFHLSRTFRHIIGWGFPEFVDRCRTEVATKMLVANQDAIETIAKDAGFGSTQAFRDAMKDYYGLLPSEIRALSFGFAGEEG
jgi:AraC-like DNA-binding protein